MRFNKQTGVFSPSVLLYNSLCCGRVVIIRKIVIVIFFSIFVALRVFFGCKS